MKIFNSSMYLFCLAGFFFYFFFLSPSSITTSPMVVIDVNGIPGLEKPGMTLQILYVIFS